MLKPIVIFSTFVVILFACGISFADSSERGTLLFEDGRLSLWLRDSQVLEQCKGFKESARDLACFRLNSPQDVAIMITRHEGYGIGSEGELLAHLSASAAAMEGIANVRVLQARVIKREPLLGLLEVERRDGAVREFAGFEGDGAVMQSGVIIPVSGVLYQVFVYASMKSGIEELGLSYWEEVVDGIEIRGELAPPRKTALSTFRVSVILGAGLALIGIVFLQIRSYLAKRGRREEERKDLQN